MDQSENIAFLTSPSGVLAKVETLNESMFAFTDISSNVSCNLTIDFTIDFETTDIPLTFAGNCSLEWENPMLILGET